MATERQFIPAIVQKNARIACRNFSGKPDKYRNTDRKFLYCVPNDKVEELKAYGWNIKQFPMRGDDEEPSYYIPVKVNMDGRKPAKVFLYTKKNEIRLTEETINQLDWAEIDKIDIAIVPYRWQKEDGSSGISAYLKELRVTVVEDIFSDDYASYSEDFTDDGGVPFDLE